MDFAESERFRLKRKYQDTDIHNLYMNSSPYGSIKRPLFELEKDQNATSKLNLGLLSHLNHDINHVSLSTKDDVVMEIENGRVVGLDEPQPMNSLISTRPSHDAMGQPIGKDPSHIHISQTVPKSPVQSHGCSECLAGKSGHIHHIGRWKLIDSPNGFCQL